MSAIITNSPYGAITRIPTEIWTEILGLAISAEERSARPDHLEPTRGDFSDMLRFESGGYDDSITVVRTRARREHVWNSLPTIEFSGDGSPWQCTVRARKRLMLVCKKWNSEIFAHLYAHVYIFRPLQLVALVQTLRNSQARARSGRGAEEYGRWIRKATFQVVVLPHMIRVFDEAFQAFLNLCPNLAGIEHRDHLNEEYWYGPESSYVSPSARIFTLGTMLPGQEWEETHREAWELSQRLASNLTCLSFAVDEPLTATAARMLLANLQNLRSVSFCLRTANGYRSKSLEALWQRRQCEQAAGVRTEIVYAPHLANLTLKDSSLEEIVELTNLCVMPSLRRCAIDTLQHSDESAGRVIHNFALAHGGNLEEFLVRIASVVVESSPVDAAEVLRLLPRLQRALLPPSWSLDNTPSYGMQSLRGPTNAETVVSNLRSYTIMLGNVNQQYKLYSALKRLANRKRFPFLETVRVSCEDFASNGYVGWPVHPDRYSLHHDDIPAMLVEDFVEIHESPKNWRERLATWIRLYDQLGIRLEDQEGRRLMTRIEEGRIADPMTSEVVTLEAERSEYDAGDDASADGLHASDGDGDSDSAYLTESSDDASEWGSEDDEDDGTAGRGQSFEGEDGRLSADELRDCASGLFDELFVPTQTDGAGGGARRTREDGPSGGQNSSSDDFCSMRSSNTSKESLTSASSDELDESKANRELEELSSDEWSNDPASYLEVKKPVAWDEALHMF